jgi:hypothetical protein
MKSEKPLQFLARTARDAARGRDVLYHGTRYPGAILETGKLLFSISGNQAVCFTRSSEEAARWAMLDRDDDEGRAAILVFCRSSLRTRYKVKPFHDRIWDTATHRPDEQEERIVRRDVGIAPHLIALISTPTDRSRSQIDRMRSWRTRAEVREHPRRQIKYPTEAQCNEWAEAARSEVLNNLRELADAGVSWAATALDCGSWTEFVEKMRAAPQDTRAGSAP